MTEVDEWPQALLDKLGSTVVQVLYDLRRASSLEEAAAMVQGYGLTEEEMALVLTRCRPGIPETMHGHKSPRAAFYAAVWLLGASYRALGRSQNRTHQSIADAVKRRLPEPRERLRLKDIPESVISELWRVFYANPRVWQQTPHEIAAFLSPYLEEE